jgi:hypothetical protein
MCWRTAWNTTHSPFWRFLSPERFAWELGFGHAADCPLNRRAAIAGVRTDSEYFVMGSSREDEFMKVEIEYCGQ